MKKLKYTPPEILQKYFKLFSIVEKKHGMNFESAIENLLEHKRNEIAFFEVGIDKLIKESKSKNYKPASECLKVLQNSSEKESKNYELHQAAFYMANDIPAMAKKQHLDNMIFDTEIVYSHEINKYEQKIQARIDAQIHGADGGKVFSQKSEESVFLALDLWRVKYQEYKNIEAANLILSSVNEKILELNQAISDSRNTSNTPMLEISEPKTIALWIGAFKALMKKRKLPKYGRKCIKFYYDNYYLENEFYSLKFKK